MGQRDGEPDEQEMSYTIFASPLHVLPQEIDMPVMRDGDAVGTSIGFRRRYLRPLSAWQLEIPGKQELLEPVLGLLQYVQGDTPFWFDGAGFGEETEPILFGVGIGTIRDYNLPHRHVFVSSLVIYINGTVYSNWEPLGGDALSTCDSIRFDSGLGIGNQAMAKYRRRIKCLVRVEDKVSRRRVFRGDVNANNIHNLTVTLLEVAT